MHDNNLTGWEITSDKLAMHEDAHIRLAGVQVSEAGQIASWSRFSVRVISKQAGGFTTRLFIMPRTVRAYADVEDFSSISPI